MTPTITPLPVPEDVKTKFYHVESAVKHGHLGVISAVTKTGEQHYLLAVIVPDGDGYHIAPLARIMEDNEFENYRDPTL